MQCIQSIGIALTNAGCLACTLGDDELIALTLKAVARANEVLIEVAPPEVRSVFVRLLAMNDQLSEKLDHRRKSKDGGS